MGNKCRPKYFGARKLSVRLDKTRELKCYWQKSYSEYFSNCISKGLVDVSDPLQLDWVDLGTNKATAAISPSTQNIYSQVSYINITYKSATKALKFSIFSLYNIPTPIDSEYPLITSNFTDLSEAWLASKSKF